MRKRGLFLVLSLILIVLVIVITEYLDKEGIGPRKTKQLSENLTEKESVLATIFVDPILASWVNKVIVTANGKELEVNGKRVFYHYVPIEPWEAWEAIKAKRGQPTIWITGGRVWSSLADKDDPKLIASTTVLARTPLVIAMWESLAKALGWPNKEIGWRDLERLATDPKGWGLYGYPEIGKLRWGHPNPDTTAGISTFAAMAYAASGSKGKLAVAQVRSGEAVKLAEELEQAVVRYDAPAELLEAMFDGKWGYMQAAAVPEFYVAEANEIYSEKLVAIYPEDGTIWNEILLCALGAEWISDEQRKAAELLADIFLDQDQQIETMANYNLRPVAAGEVFTLTLGEGLDAKRTPEGGLTSIDREAWTELLALSADTKQTAMIVVALDQSGSMKGIKLQRAKEAAIQFLDQVNPKDKVWFLTFGGRIYQLNDTFQVLEKDKDELIRNINRLKAGGNTPLRDTIIISVDKMVKLRGQSGQMVIVVLTDGEDTSSSIGEEDFFARLPSDAEARLNFPRIFTIPLGERPDGGDANTEFLNKVAVLTGAKMYPATPENIAMIYKEVSKRF